MAATARPASAAGLPAPRVNVPTANITAATIFSLLMNMSRSTPCVSRTAWADAAQANIPLHDDFAAGSEREPASGGDPSGNRAYQRLALFPCGSPPLAGSRSLAVVSRSLPALILLSIILRRIETES